MERDGLSSARARVVERGVSPTAPEWGPSPLRSAGAEGLRQEPR